LTGSKASQTAGRSASELYSLVKGLTCKCRNAWDCRCRLPPFWRKASVGDQATTKCSHPTAGVQKTARGHRQAA